MISICSPQLGLSPESNSGGEVHDREILSRLSQKNITIHTLLPKGRSHPELENLKVSSAFIRSMVPPHIYNFFVFPYLLKTYLFHKFDILRIHNPYFIGPAAAAFKKIYPRIPIVTTYHHLETGLNYFIDKSLIHSFDHIIAVSQSTKQEIIKKFSFPSKKISVIFTGVDNRFKPCSKPANFVTKYNSVLQTVLMFFGSLKPRKNLMFLLDLLKNIKNQKNIKLIFAGTGPMLKKLKEKTKQLNLENQVIFTGYIKEKDKVQHYQLADILLLPSLVEGFGMTIIEAGACGVPSIGADHYSIKEIIQHKKTGLLAQPNNLDDWTEKTVELIKSKTLRQQMGKFVQKHVRSKFSWDNAIKMHLKIFNQLINKKNLIKQ